ncbi:DUF885 family protein [Oleiharenicola lentus]|uniref:DUF885 family protein n=1 Tax=Oleiharenicola lentus TaxID=2508720 RepID=UPI003F666EE6
MLSRILIGFVFIGGAVVAADDFRHGQPSQSQRPAADYVPDLTSLVKPQTSELRELVERFTRDRDGLRIMNPVTGSPLQLKRMEEFYRAWDQKLDALPYEPFGVEGRIDWHLLKTELAFQQELIGRQRVRMQEMEPLLPFFNQLAELQEKRREYARPEAKASAAVLADARVQLEAARKALEAGLSDKSAEVSIKPNRIVALRAINQLQASSRQLGDWFKHYDGYDPEFGWWTREPYKRLTTAMDDYSKFLREKIVGAKPGEDEPIVGDPIGAAGLAVDLKHEMIPYTPEQLIAIAQQEFAWCEAEWKKVAQELGLGDDWKAALEKMKQDYVEPGDQPQMIAGLAYEAVDFITKRDLLTVPPHMIDDWYMTMMSPERQKVSPFFLGGDQIIVSFPTDTMDHADKLNSLRANNQHLCRATVFHELIPGHHMQGWYTDRYNQHRQLFYTPFWIEGWALWWEFHLWDLGFQKKPLNRAGALFWRTHRCARIIFSLNFHLGKWTPEECINFLVDKVGHDRHTATGEVRRSFNGDYSPLYQVGYMMGAIQLRSLYAEAVKSGKMTEKQFHDSVMVGGSMPIEMVRAHVLGLKLPRDYQSSWKFADEKR